MDDSRSAPSVPRVNSQGADPLIGRMINDRYRVVGIIARGGMGKVYRAEQAPLGRLVALKVLNPNYSGDNDPEFHKRFFLEASTASKLTHPNTVTIFDYGKTDDDIYYIAMELLEGRTLYRALREEGAFSPERVMHIGRQICRSLREAHGLGVIHRDLKPANVYLVQHGDESDFVKVLDFGLVKNLEGDGEELTQAGLFMGSPKYMSPEQIRGERVDSRVDVYALGVMMYEMLAGKVPFDRPNSVNILMAHIQEEVPPVSEMNANVWVPQALEDVVRKCMAKSCEDRYSSMEEVLVALKTCAPLVTSASSDSAGVASQAPGAPKVHVPGDLLSGGTPTSTPRGQVSSPAAALSAPVAAPAAPSAEAGRSKAPFVLVAIAAAALVLGFMIASNGRDPAQPATVRAAEQVVRPKAVTAAQVKTQLAPPSTAQSAPAVAPAKVNEAVPAPQTVLVSLRSTPPGAMVTSGEDMFGPTPATIEWRGAAAERGREVTFVFHRKGYRDFTVTRQISGDRLDVEAPAMDPIPIRRSVRESRPAVAPLPEPVVTPLPTSSESRAPEPAEAPAPAPEPTPAEVITPAPGSEAEAH